MPNAPFIILFYSLFVESFCIEIAHIFFPYTPHVYILTFYSLPMVYFLIGGLSSSKLLTLIRSSLALVLPFVLTLIILRKTGELTRPIFPLTWELGAGILPYLFPLLVVSFCSLIVLREIRIRNSLWTVIFAASLVQMILFSNVNKLWYPYFPIHLAAGILLQLSLRLRKQKDHQSSGLLVHYIWSVLLISAALYSGFHYPEFQSYWFQSDFAGLNSWNISTQTRAAPLSTEQVFAWKNTDLGKPWQPSNIPIFYAVSPEPVYWRSQVYNMYNGNDWLRTSVSDPVNSQPPIPLYPLPTDLGREEEYKVQLVQPISGGIGLFLPSHSKSLLNITPTSTAFEADSIAETLTLIHDLPSPTNYTVSVTLPMFDVGQLRKVTIPPETNKRFYGEISPWTPWDLSHLKERDKLAQLAAMLTRNYDNPYDKVEALATYLKTNETYTLNPPAGDTTEDFVSNFLFNTHQGYCVHFSSALVTMVQSLGYPARWVVGFNEGEPLPDDMKNPFPKESHSNVRLMTQANAHSWAEVYFPDYGWIPFEATPGFYYPQTPEETIETSALSNGSGSAHVKSIAKQDSRLLEDRVAFIGTSSSFSVKLKPIHIVLTIIALFILLGLIVFLNRILHKRRWLRMSERERLQYFYEKFLNQLKNYNIIRFTHETPSEFMRRLPSYGSEWDSNWQKLTLLAEEGLYAGEVDSTQVQEMMELTSQILDQCSHNLKKTRFALSLWRSRK